MRAPIDEAPYPTRLYTLNARVRRFELHVRGRIACSRERNGPTSPDPTLMFPAIPANIGAHGAADERRTAPARRSMRAKNTRVLRRPIRSATRLVRNVYPALLRMVRVSTAPTWTGSRPTS